MMTVEFRIQYPKNMTQYCKRYGLNAYWAGKHWSQRKKDADDFHSIVWAELRKQGFPRAMFTKPVSISFFHNTRMDIDNHAAIEKMVVDALKGYFLENDSKRFYARKVSAFHDEPYMLVRIEEVGK